MSRTIEHVPLSSLTAHPKNPKAHDTATIDASVGRFGYIEPIVVDGRTGMIVSGHGRTKTLLGMHERGETPPDGVQVKDGEWLVPVVSGWSSRTDSEAHAALIALNRTGELGGWVDDSLLELLDDLSGIEDGLLGVGYGEDDVENLRARLADIEGTEGHKDFIEEGNSAPAKRRPSATLDYILSINAGGSFAEAQIGARMGWQSGVITSSVSGARSYIERFPRAPRIAFMDNEWHDYDHERHVRVLSEFTPKYATTRDLLTREQASNAGVAYYTVKEVLEMAAEVAEHADNVIIIPKYDCLDRIPEEINGKRVVLGYSVPSSYGGTRLPAEAFKGRPVHLLGGPWKSQRAYLNVLGEDVVSLDNNHVLNVARYGQVCMADGSLKLVDEVVGQRLSSSLFPALTLSLAYISTAIHEEYGVTPPSLPMGDPEWDTLGEIHDNREDYDL